MPTSGSTSPSSPPPSLSLPEVKPPPAKVEWPMGSLKGKSRTFDDFAAQNFVKGTPTCFTKKEVRKPILIYTPEVEKDAIIKIWRVMMRFMGDMVDYRNNYEELSGHKSQQPEMGSVMTRLCRLLGSPQKDSPFGPQISQREPVVDIPMQTLPNKPNRGSWKRLKETITQRILGHGRRTVFHLLPLEETLRTQLERVQFIVAYGILRPKLRDEIYCGLCRQLRSNSYKDSVKSGWLLMNVLTGCFPPSERCLDAILHFLETGPKIHTLLAKALLLRTIKNGDRLHPHSAVELEAATEHKPVELQIHLARKGETITVPIDGASLASEVCKGAYQRIGLKHSFGFHLFVTTRDRVTSLGCGRDHVMDIISQMEQVIRDQQLTGEMATWRFYLRKELVEPWDDFKADSIAMNLVYEQLKWGVVKHDYVFTEEENLHNFFAKIAYIEHSGKIDEEAIKTNLIEPFIQNHPNIDDFTENRIANETEQYLSAIQQCFQSLYENGHSNKPNSFRTKLEVIQTGLEHWTNQFARTFDARAVMHNNMIGQHSALSNQSDQSTMTSEGMSTLRSQANVLEGVCYIAINGTGVSFLNDNYLVVLHVDFEEILQLSEESNEDVNTAPSLMFKLLGEKFIECASHDIHDVIELVSYFLSGLNDRSTYAVAIDDYTAQSTDDLDLEVGDVIALDKPAIETVKEQTLNVPGAHLPETLVYEGICERTGQKGNVNSALIHVLPTLERPSDKIIALYRDFADTL